VLPASGEQFTAPLGQEFNMNKSKMFCNQCSQHTTNCATVLGQCNKTPQVAHMQDEVVQIAVEMGYYAHTIRVAGMEVPAEVNHFMLRSMFSTLTNVNNDPVRMSEYVRTGMSLVEKLKSIAGDVPKPALPPVSILAQRWMAADKNAASVCEMLMYGLKGLCAYADHALVLGREDPRIYAFVQEALAFLASPARDDLGQALAMCLRCGEANLWTMELLYEANTASLGTPEPTKVQVRPVPGKCVLVSGHDLHVLEGLLAACEPRGVKVYTHGEMLPGHAYPRLKAYASLAGHFGGAWNKQAVEFRHFPGPIVMTSNCLTEPQKAYKDSLFTFGPVGWPGVAHLGEEAEAIKWDKVHPAPCAANAPRRERRPCRRAAELYQEHVN
jgi:hydroxylamine reductase